MEGARTRDSLRHQYEIERRLADQLRNSAWPDRGDMYSAVYEELFMSVPDHPQLLWKANPEVRRGHLDSRLRTLERFIGPDSTYLELGAGDCVLAFEVARQVRHVYAIEVSETISEGQNPPPNFELVLSDGRDVPVPRGSVDVAFSDQLMEHLHPDDAVHQLRGIHDALGPGGTYIFITPNRLFGPSDISRSFDDVPTGFHLQEYTNAELARMLEQAGFSSVRAFFSRRGRVVTTPLAPVLALERALERASPRGKRFARSRVGVGLLGCHVVAHK